MKDHEVLEIVLQTADELSKNGDDWEGDVFDFVSASGAIADDLSSPQVEGLHREMCGSSFVTRESEIFFYRSKGRQQIFVKPIEPLGVA